MDEVPDPAEPGPYEAVVESLWSGICGTDVKEFTGHGGSVSRAPHPLTGAGLPLVLGHEFSARVVAVGANVEGVAVGEEVAIMPLQHCGQCLACHQGQHTHCVVKAWTGLSSPWGGFGERALVQSYQLTPLEGISAVAGAVIEPAAVALHAALRAGIGPGDTVFVAGAGAIGALTVMVAKALGASAVHVFEINPERAALVQSLGAAIVPESARDDIAAYLRERTGGHGVHVAMDCAGKPSAHEACVASVRVGGTVGVPAVHPGPTTVDVRRITRDDLTLVGSVGYSRESWEKTVLMVRAGVLPIERIVTSRIGLDEIVDKGFQALAKPGDELKILVQVNQ
ncbi:alcohol dehydrogenase catalytic domain-containing protein [Nonomuraea sp. K274]|uniref:Alcohol dehydrogenase catalytic domain-containing protein n=1 Tax=Nonomuraea cypriaca TaxID=1187855 RepID=A0A931A8J2_9ACTN|nr:zinc-binding dehydrogenase [Nonomuraea cypriaca]MBF8184787.1 alcohol dehydrogenase catalytic domain-containing protein [Nonomuraea cypriaca]